jgi:hypothetical protein
MAKPYFRQVPDLDYVSRLPDSKISDYIRVKNLFRKGKIRDDIFENLSYFTKSVLFTTINFIFLLAQYSVSCLS